MFKPFAKITSALIAQERSFKRVGANPVLQVVVPALTSPVAPTVRFLFSRSPDSSAFAAEQSRRHVTPAGA